MKRRPTRRDDHERVGRHGIRPLCRQTDQLALAVMEVDTIQLPALAALDELELLAGQRMKWMGHAHARRIT